MPELKQRYDEHISANDEILPHIFLGDVTRFVIEASGEGAIGSEDSVCRILNYFEHSMCNSDECVRELISVSFIENLTGHKNVVGQLIPLMGPSLKNELES